jgi:hypothetical protein
MASDPRIFRDRLIIDAGGAPRSLGASMDPWQKADFEALDGGWLRCMGHEVEGGFSRAWLERCRGSSKTSDLAASIVFALWFAPRAVRGVACAADRDQAGLLTNAIKKLIDLNPWLGAALEVGQWKATNKKTGSELSILASDVASSYGLLLDFCLADELTIWPPGSGEDFFGSMLSAIAKRPHALLVVIGNAGFQESWQAKLRAKVQQDEKWYFHAVDKPASWIRPEHLDEQRRLLPGPVFSRLWENEWSGGAGDALQETDIAASVREAGPLERPEEGWCYFGGLDLSISRHNSAAVIVGRSREGFVKLAAVRLWTPGKTSQIDLGLVRDTALALSSQFGGVLWGYDQWQAALLAQDLAKADIFMVPVAFSGRPSQEMASELIELFASRRIRLFDEPRLLADLRRLRIVETAGGWKLHAPASSAGHADLAFALAMAVYTARQHRWRIDELPPHLETGQPLCAGKTDPGMLAMYGPWHAFPSPANLVPCGPRSKTGTLYGGGL